MKNTKLNGEILYIAVAFTVTLFFMLISYTFGYYSGSIEQGNRVWTAPEIGHPYSSVLWLAWSCIAGKVIYDIVNSK